MLRRSFWFCTIDDPSTIDTRHAIGVENIMVEVDYPHGDSTWPDTQAVIEAAWGHLPAAERRAMCSENAAALFRHPLPEVASPRTGRRRGRSATEDGLARAASENAAIRRAEHVVAGVGVGVPAAGGGGAAVDVDRLAGDVARQRRRQEHGGAGHLVDVAGAAHRHRRAHVLGIPSGATAQVPSVRVTSGASALTRMPCGASSRAAVWVRLMTPALAAA